MKFLKIVLSWFLHILNIPLSLLSAFGLVWYTLPTLKTTIIGESVLKLFTESTIFWITIGSFILLTVSAIISLILNKRSKAKVKNFFIHTNTWLMGIIGIVLAIATFILVNPIVTIGITIEVYRKVIICINLALLIIFHIFANKISKIINRKIQSYENSKELSVVGRSSVIWVNILKLIEILFPEILILLLICSIVSWEVASYFTIILFSCIIPMIGNIVCDFISRKEFIKNNNEAHDKLVDDIANKTRR